jgi:hypothetical protein
VSVDRADAPNGPIATDGAPRDAPRGHEAERSGVGARDGIVPAQQHAMRTDVCNALDQLATCAARVRRNHDLAGARPPRHPNDDEPIAGAQRRQHRRATDLDDIDRAAEEREPSRDDPDREPDPESDPDDGPMPAHRRRLR